VCIFAYIYIWYVPKLSIIWMCNSGSYLDLTSLFRGNLSDWNLWIVWVKWSFFVATPACPTFSPGTKIGKHLLVTDVVTHLDAGSLQSWCSEALPGAFEPHPLAGAHHLSVQCFDERWGAGRPRRAISPVRQFFSPVGKVFWGRLNLGQRNSLKWIGFKFYLEQLDTLDRWKLYRNYWVAKHHGCLETKKKIFFTSNLTHRLSKMPATEASKQHVYPH
jgi:hypothetical protein